jgi:hypothetical protein
LRNQVKKSYEKAQQEEAFKELIGLIGANSGKVPYGAVKELVKRYHSNGFKAVTWKNIYYRLDRSKTADSHGSILGKTVSVSENNTALISDLSQPTSNHSSTGISCTEEDDDGSSISIVSTLNNSKRGGRRKGSTKSSKSESIKTRENVITRCAMLYNKEREMALKSKKNIPAGTLKEIVQKEVQDAGLPTNSISLDTIRSRIKRNNVTGYNPCETPLIAEVEPIICDFCIRLGKLGQPLTKSTVIEFANSVINQMEYQEKVEASKKLRGLNNVTRLGVRWYRGFLSRHNSLLTTKGTVIKDVKRRTWVTRENFENMYNNVYQTMVEAGVAEEVSKQIQHEAGLPSKFKLTRPEYVLFVDETGCNTNQLMDGRVGNECFILPKANHKCGAPTGATTNLHFIVLPFISGTGEPVMCAIIFKSEQEVNEIPVSWKTGIDITCEDVDDTA